MKVRRVMLIDDNKIDLFIHSEIIRRLPFEKTVLQYSFAGEALEYLGRHGAADWPDVILVDIYMPVIDGFLFLEKFSAFPDELRAGCSVVMVSSSLDSADLSKARHSANVSGFLEKPLNLEKLHQFLRPVE